MEPYLIALDLDGTLLRSDMTIGEKTKAILQKLHAKGHQITIATGRILKLAATVPTDLEMPAHVVACNGALVKHADHGIIAAHTYSDEQRQQLEQSLKQIELALQPTKPYGLYYHYYSEDTIYASALEHTAKKFAQVSSKRLESERVNLVILPAKSRATNVYKYGIYRDGSYDFDKARNMLDQIPGLSTMFSAPNLLDIMRDGVTKWTGILELATHLGIPESRIMVFGDNENDLEMLEKAGVSVAMGNAAAEIKAVAKHTTETNDQEGIYTFLQSYFEME
mgnify:CR=1 FL=1